MTRSTARILVLLVAFISTSLVIACGGGSNNGGSGNIAATSPNPGTPPSGTSGSGGSGTTSGSGTTTGGTGTTTSGGTGTTTGGTGTTTSGGTGTTTGSGTGTTTSGTGTTTGGTTGQPSQPPQTNAVETIYTASNASGTVITVGYNIDPTSGHLKKIGSFQTGHIGWPPYANPQQRVFVANLGASQCDRGYCTMDTHLSTLVRDTSTGAVKIGMDNVLFPKRFIGIAMLANGKFAYTVEWQSPEGTNPMIRGFRIDQETGVLTQIDIGDVPFIPSGVLFANPRLPLLYTLEARCCFTTPVHQLRIWSADENTGRLTETAYSPAIVSGPFEFPPTITNDGAYFYAAKPILVDSELDVFRMDARGVPEIQPLATVATEQFPAFEEFVLHPSGTIAYGWGLRPNSTNTEVRNALHAYRLDPATNKFTDLDLSAKMPATVMAPFAIDKSGKHLYMSTSFESQIVLYNVDPATGDLTFVGNEPLN